MFNTITARTAVFLILRTLSKTGTDQIQPTSRRFRMDSKNWALLDRETQTSSYYLRQIVKVPKAGPFTVRFKAKCGEGQTSRIRIYFAGTNKYTDAGSVTETYKTFELEFDNVTGQFLVLLCLQLYFRNKSLYHGY